MLLQFLLNKTNEILFIIDTAYRQEFSNLFFFHANKEEFALSVKPDGAVLNKSYQSIRVPTFITEKFHHFIVYQFITDTQNQR